MGKPSYSFFALIGCLIMGCSSHVQLQKSTDSAPPHNVILITMDGLRWQELFTGMDDSLLADRAIGGVKYPDRLRARFGGETAHQRREKLLPFFWQNLAGQGMVFGNRNRNSAASVANPQRISYPGYAELLTGEVQTTISTNAAKPIPRQTVLEFTRQKLGLKQTDVAVFGSWERFNEGAALTNGSIVCNAGYQSVDESLLTPGMRALNTAQHDLRTPWDDVRHDRVTSHLALEYLKTYRPRLFYLAFAETDDWGHGRRYDRVLQAAAYVDSFLAQLWSVLQSMPQYRDNTTIILTTDHGRGRTGQDWDNHKPDIPGSEEIWVAVIGPHTPNQGELADQNHIGLNQVAATVLQFLGLDPTEFNPAAGAPIPGVYQP